MKRFFTYIIATAVILTGCKEHCEVDNIPVFELSQSEFQMANYGGTVSVKVASKVNWTAKTTEDWIRLKAEDIESVDGREADNDFAATIAAPFNTNRAGGYVTVEIEVAENPAATQRNGEITFTTTDMQTFTVSVTQTAGAEDSIELDDMEGDDDFDKETKTLHFAAAGGEKTLGFTVTREWTAVVAEDAEWCSINPEAGEGGSTSITITAQPTEQFEERSTTVTITSGTASVTITVVQDGDPTIMPKDMEIMFPDPIFRAYVMENFDTDKDSKISKEEAEKVIEVSIHKDYYTPDNEKIATLEGIQYFTNMIYLECNYNKLTELDVTQNTALKYLSCSYNKLTDLDVTQNTKLTSLSCDSNQLAELDVTQNPALTNLICGFNQLTELDITHNPALTDLWCGANALTKLDVTQSPALRQLVCYINQLTELDVTHNTALVYLYCSENQLTELDVSKTNLGNSSASTPLLCGYNYNLEKLYIKKGWSIPYITIDRDTYYIPENTEIIFVE